MSACTGQRTEATMASNQNRPIKKAKREDKEEFPSLPMLLHKKDIWVGNILPFLGVGNYIFVAGVCKVMKELYQDYFSSVSEDLVPDVYPTYGISYSSDRKTLLTDTFYREAFASLSRAKFWDENTKQGSKRAYRLPDNKICETIVEYGNVLTLEWAHKQREFPWDEDTCAEAVAAGNMKLLKYAHENGCPWDEETCSAAAEAGRLDILQYAHNNGCPWDEWTCKAAARAGRFDILQYAHENGCPWDEYICSRAASEGRLDILQYAHENDCPWDWRTCSEAAGVGRLDVLQWLHENGCPWDSWTLLNAIHNGHLEIVEYARANGCPEPSPDMI